MQNKEKYGLNEARPEGATNAREPLNITQLDRSSAMPLLALYHRRVILQYHHSTRHIAPVSGGAT